MELGHVQKQKALALEMKESSQAFGKSHVGECKLSLTAKRLVGIELCAVTCGLLSF